MFKILLKITLIILANLLAFLSVGLILDALFGSGRVFTLGCVIISFPVFGMIMYFKASTLLRELMRISEHETYDRK